MSRQELKSLACTLHGASQSYRGTVHLHSQSLPLMNLKVINNLQRDCIVQGAASTHLPVLIQGLKLHQLLTPGYTCTGTAEEASSPHWAISADTARCRPRCRTQVLPLPETPLGREARSQHVRTVECGQSSQFCPQARRATLLHSQGYSEQDLTTSFQVTRQMTRAGKRLSTYPLAAYFPLPSFSSERGTDNDMAQKGRSKSSVLQHIRIQSE